MAIGLLCGLSTMERLPSDFFGMEESCWSQAKQIVVRFLGLIVSVISIIVTVVILLEGDGESTPCPNCTWLSCVPFPPWESQSQKWWYCDDCGRGEHLLWMSRVKGWRIYTYFPRIDSLILISVTAEIMQTPSLHLQLDCPDGTNVAVGLDSEEGIDRNKLESELPSYCREYCPNIDVRL